MNVQSLHPLRRTRDFGQTISDTIQFLKVHWKNLLALYLIFVVPFLLVATLLGASSFSNFFKIMGTDTGIKGVDNIFAIFSPQFTISLILYFISIVAYSTVVFLYMRLFEERGGIAPGISEVGNLFLNRFLSNTGYMFIIFIGFILMAFIAIIPILGFLVFLFGIIYMAVSLSLLFPVNTIESNPFLLSFSRMFYLIKNNWWYTFGVIMILGLIYYFFSVSISLVVNLIFGFGAINFLDTKSGFSSMTEKYFLVMGFSAIFQQIFYLVVHVGIGMHYFSLREEKDGSGLEDRLEQLGGGEGAHGHIEEQY